MSPEYSPHERFTPVTDFEASQTSHEQPLDMLFAGQGYIPNDASPSFRAGVSSASVCTELLAHTIQIQEAVRDSFDQLIGAHQDAIESIRTKQLAEQSALQGFITMLQEARSTITGHLTTESTQTAEIISLKTQVSLYQQERNRLELIKRDCDKDLLTRYREQDELLPKKQQKEEDLKYFEEKLLSMIPGEIIDERRDVTVLVPDTEKFEIRTQFGFNDIYMDNYDDHGATQAIYLKAIEKIIPNQSNGQADPDTKQQKFKSLYLALSAEYEKARTSLKQCETHITHLSRTRQNAIQDLETIEGQIDEKLRLLRTQEENLAHVQAKIHESKHELETIQQRLSNYLENLISRSQAAAGEKPPDTAPEGTHANKKCNPTSPTSLPDMTHFFENLFEDDSDKNSGATYITLPIGEHQ